MYYYSNCWFFDYVYVGISIGIYGAYYPWYKSVNDIKGWGFSVGVSWMAGVYLGGNGSFEIGNNVYTHAASVSVGAGASLAPIPTLYVKGSYTKKLFSFNIKKFIKSGKKKKSSLKGVSFTLTPFKTCVRLTCNKTKTRIYLQNNYKVKVLK